MYIVAHENNNIKYGQDFSRYKGLPKLCKRCSDRKKPFEPKDDIKEWVEFKLTDQSWEEWRKENVEEVNRLKEKYSL